MAAKQFELLSRQHAHAREAFSCGIPELDAYLKRQAGQEMRRSVAVVWVLYDTEQDTIVGYYSLSTASVVPGELPAETVRRLPRYPALPAMLIGRLAVDTRYRRQGFGELLLFDALRRALQISQSIGSVAVVVDAKDRNSEQFYERYGFRRLTGEERRLFLPMAVIASIV